METVALRRRPSAVDVARHFAVDLATGAGGPAAEVAAGAVGPAAGTVGPAVEKAEVQVKPEKVEVAAGSVGAAGSCAKPKPKAQAHARCLP